MNYRADLHLHTEASDGKLSPVELVDQAKNQGLHIISVTDHDTIAGVSDAVSHGEKIGIKVIPGIELSTEYKGESVHILGYFKNTSFSNEDFRSTLKEMTDYRVLRGKKIVDNLKEHFDISISYDKILKASRGIIARPHIAKAILEEGYDYEWEYIFKNILHEGGPAYVPKKALTIDEGIDILKSVNALAVLAHPLLIKKSSIEELMSFNFDGIEAVYHMNTKEDTEFFTAAAKRFGKLITAGSDFHGIDKDDNGHGSIGCVSLTGHNLERFMDVLNIKI